MQVIGVTVAGAVIVGLVVSAVAWRWPLLSAPRISPRTVLAEAEQHPSFARLLWSRHGAARLGSYALGAALLIAALGGALIGLVLWMVRSHEGLARYDVSVARWGSTHATQASTEVLRAISQLGSTIGAITIAVVAAAFASRKLKPQTVVAFLATVMIGESVMVAVIKHAVERARPNIDRLTGFSGSSFPSGHAATAAATFAAVALLLGVGQDRRRRAILTGLAAGLAVAVAATRVLLGVHWLTDVVAGVVLGWTWFAIVSIGFGGRLVRFEEPVEAAERVLAAPMASPPPA